ncbi:MAG: ABC transporter substrate-binding protein [Fibrobacter sp.]|nr:ABC transporter substrate-binding protein [Fibrobacter sp.]
MKKFVTGIVLTLMCVFIIPETAHSSPVLDQSVRLYKAGKYDSTIIIIRTFLKKNGKDPETEKLVPLIIEALIRKGDYNSVHRLFSVFRQKFPKSLFMPRLFYIEGVALAKEEKFQQAVIAFSSALEGGISPQLDSLARKNTEVICKLLTIEEFSTLSSMPLNLNLLEIVKYSEIVKLFNSEQFVKVQGLADDFRKMFPRSRFDSYIRDYASQAKEKQRGTIQVGILAPISGDEEEIGKKVVLGAQLAIDQANVATGLPIKPIILDTKGNMVETAKRTKELIEDHKVSVIVGPVLSHTATVSAAMLIGKPAVMISPTATDDGIASLSRNVFQMNVTLGILARRVARYAIENLNVKEFAILAPKSTYGNVMAESFKDELKRRHMDLVAEAYYEEGANDFTPEFMSLRNQLLARHLEKISIEKGTEIRGRVSRADSLKYLDSALAVGGLFMPGDAEDIVMLAPQTAFHRIRTQLLGSNGWHSQKVIKDGKQYVTNAIISTSFETDLSSNQWLEFKKAFKTKYNIDPDRVAALGYDAASLVVKVIKEVGDDPVKIGEALRRIQGFNGLSGNVSFDQDNGANTEASIFKISTSGFLRVQ